MKLNKLSKHKNTKKNTKRNNKNKKRNNNTKKRINRLKGGDGVGKERLFDFIKSLPINSSKDVKSSKSSKSSKDDKDAIILTYFDIKIILLYIVAYKLLKTEELIQIFRWFLTNYSTTPPTNPFIMTLLEDTTPTQTQTDLLNNIYKKINLAFPDKPDIIQFKYDNSNPNPNTTVNPFDEHDQFMTYINTVLGSSQLKKTQPNFKTQTILNNMNKQLKNSQIEIKKLTYLENLLVKSNCEHFAANYCKFFAQNGHLTFIKKSEDEVIKCSPFITSVIRNNSSSITTNNNPENPPHYNCFVKNCALLINFEKLPKDNNANSNRYMEMAEHTIKHAQALKRG